MIGLLLSSLSFHTFCVLYYAISELIMSPAEQEALALYSLAGLACWSDGSYMLSSTHSHSVWWYIG